jgi:hypothetical protein
MITTAQILTILGILFVPMLSTIVLVLSLAALNLSLGIRTLFVKTLAFIFDYATKIKRDKEVPINPNVSLDEPPTPPPSPKSTTITPPLVKKSPDDPIEINSETLLISETKLKLNNELTTSDQDPQIPRTSLQNDIQFKLGKNILLIFS